MIKSVVAFVTMIATVFSGSCLGGEPTIFNDDSIKAKDRLEQLIEAVENRDKDALRAMFSEQALEEAEELDGRMYWLFDFVSGDITSWEQEGGSNNASNNRGHKWKESRYWFFVNTDTEKYVFYTVEYPEDTEHPENVGLYMLRVRVYKVEERDQSIGRDEWQAGIYLSEEQRKEMEAAADKEAD